MPKLIILGSSNAIADEKHENTHMAVVGRERSLLIDCPGNPIVRLRRAGLDFHAITDLILTHFHPDHVSGLPLLLMDMWLLGRSTPLTIHGLPYTLERAERTMALYNWTRWPDFFTVSFNHLAEEEMTPVVETADWRAYASPVRHLIPTIGLRLEFPLSEKAVAYSCDTEPCPQVVRLASGADILIHETAGNSQGHSGAAGAGGVAQEAKAGSLYLIHYPTGDFDSDSLIPLAGGAFDGPVALAQDLMEFEF
jgi:ribonuclease Z